MPEKTETSKEARNDDQAETRGNATQTRRAKAQATLEIQPGTG